MSTASCLDCLGNCHPTASCYLGLLDVRKHGRELLLPSFLGVRVLLAQTPHCVELGSWDWGATRDSRGALCPVVSWRVSHCGSAKLLSCPMFSLGAWGCSLQLHPFLSPIGSQRSLGHLPPLTWAALLGGWGSGVCTHSSCIR